MPSETRIFGGAGLIKDLTAAGFCCTIRASIIAKRFPILTRPSSRWPLAAALLLGLAPCVTAQIPMTPEMPPPPPPRPVAAPPAAPIKLGPPGVAATVNGTPITKAAVTAQVLKTVGPQFVSQLVDQMITISLIDQEAVRQRVVISPAQVALKLAQVRKRAAAQIPGGLDTYLSQRHQTLADYKAQMVTELKVEALVKKTLPPVASVARRHVRHLLILTTNPGSPTAPGPGGPHTDPEALALIAKAQAELKAGKSFEEVANEFTEDPSGKGKGGDLGIMDASTQFVPEFKAAALALKAGEVTPQPVKTQFGYHLIQCVSTSAAPLPSDKALYTAADQAAKQQQIQTAIRGYVENLKKKATIVNYTPAPPPAPTPPGFFPGAGGPAPAP